MSVGKQTVIVRFDTELQVTLPACGECSNEPCPMCKSQAIEAAVQVIRGSWAVDSDLDGDEGFDIDVYSDCSEDDVAEVWVE